MIYLYCAMTIMYYHVIIIYTNIRIETIDANISTVQFAFPSILTNFIFSPWQAQK